MKSVFEAALDAERDTTATQELPAGKRKLIEAALRLTAGGRGFASSVCANSRERRG